MNRNQGTKARRHEGNAGDGTTLDALRKGQAEARRH